MKQVIVHTDPDELIVLKLPRGWQFGKDFQVRVEHLLLPTEDGMAVPVELLQVDGLQVAHKPIDLDGKTGIGLSVWLEACLNLDDEMLSVVLDPEIRKIAKVTLMTAETEPTEIGSDLYQELTTPEVVVVERTIFAA